MGYDEYAFLLGLRRLGPPEAEQAELELLRKRFRSHHIFCDTTTGRGLRYLAHRAALDARPHTIITDDIAELREQLEQGVPPALAHPAAPSCRAMPVNAASQGHVRKPKPGNTKRLCRKTPNLVSG